MAEDKCSAAAGARAGSTPARRTCRPSGSAGESVQGGAHCPCSAPHRPPTWGAATLLIGQLPLQLALGPRNETLRALLPLQAEEPRVTPAAVPQPDPELFSEKAGALCVSKPGRHVACQPCTTGAPPTFTLCSAYNWGRHSALPCCVATLVLSRCTTWSTPRRRVSWSTRRRRRGASPSSRCSPRCLAASTIFLGAPARQRSCSCQAAS